jgi:hypothetical protein
MHRELTLRGSTVFAVLRVITSSLRLALMKAPIYILITLRPSSSIGAKVLM